MEIVIFILGLIILFVLLKINDNLVKFNVDIHNQIIEIVKKLSEKEN